MDTSNKQALRDVVNAQKVKCEWMRLSKQLNITPVIDDRQDRSVNLEK